MPWDSSADSAAAADRAVTSDTPTGVGGATPGAGPTTELQPADSTPPADSAPGAGNDAAARDERGRTARATAELEILDRRVPVGGRSVRVTVVRAPVGEDDFMLGATAEVGGEAYTLATYIERSGSRVAFSGGYVKSYAPPEPTGLVKSGGILLNPAAGHRVQNGVILIEGARIAIRRFTGGGQVDGWRDALQAGPLLVQDGQSALTIPVLPRDSVLNRVQTQMYPRAFVALDARGRVVLGVTEELSLPELVGILVAPTAQGGYEVRSALNLPKGALVVETRDRSLAIGNPRLHYPNAFLLK